MKKIITATLTLGMLAPMGVALAQTPPSTTVVPETAPGVITPSTTPAPTDGIVQKPTPTPSGPPVTATSDGSGISREVSAANKATQEQIRTLRTEMEAKIKAIRDEYQAKIKALQQSLKTRVEGIRETHKREQQKKTDQRKRNREQKKAETKQKRENRRKEVEQKRGVEKTKHQTAPAAPATPPSAPTTPPAATAPPIQP